eukprot:363893-Chlamydomonas_euryale.AAC.7
MHVLGVRPVSASAGVIGLNLWPRQMFCARANPPRFHIRLNARTPHAHTACVHAGGIGAYAARMRPHAWMHVSNVVAWAACSLTAAYRMHDL